MLQVAVAVKLQRPQTMVFRMLISLIISVACVAPVVLSVSSPCQCQKKTKGRMGASIHLLLFFAAFRWHPYEPPLRLPTNKETAQAWQSQ